MKVPSANERRVQKIDWNTLLANLNVSCVREAPISVHASAVLCAVLWCCVVMCCTVQYCLVLYGVELYRTVLSCYVRYCVVLCSYCVVLFDET